jgi:rSAM/selenodomain-associated transferase 2
LPKFEYPLSFVSIIIPTLNEADNIKSLLEIFDNLDESVFEVIISDSAVSRDDMSFLAQKRYVKYIKSGQTGRAYQMNDGAKIAKNNIFAFLHADVRPSDSFIIDIREAINQGFSFGFFSYRFEPTSRLLDINASFTKSNGIFAGGGDQIHFMTKEVFDMMGGYNASFTIMEDFEFIKRFRKTGLPIKVISNPAIVSSRKYNHNSWLKVNLLNMLAFVMFKLGVQPDKIKNVYYKNLKNPNV